MSRVRVDAGRITDWESFHRVFGEAMGLPRPYGEGMDAWIDGMSHLGEAEAILIIEVAKSIGFRCRCPEQFAELVECTALVNHRFAEEGRAARLALVFA